ncbi:MAG: 1-acyl-sn-glycerol-3-phosphate acyltransferase [Deltaproteobacteria bacterium]|nr:MAG: 1-acyl-sn-glycerol-3-phosphate acyltransferase [Deltaproteobacteria bacterium]
MLPTMDAPVHIEPTAANLVAVTRRVERVRPLFRAGLWPFVRLDVEGVENLPANGPVILLANHANMLDPILLSTVTPRPIQWMGTETLQRTRVLGPLLKAAGTIPTKRFRRNLQAARLAKAWCKQGAVVGVFPEGERSWCGRVQELRPGIATLVRIVGAPVVFAQVQNSYRHWPRWTTFPRNGRIVVRYSEPVHFARDAAPEHILATIRDALDVDPRAREDLPTRGLRLAQGLSNLVFVCPACDEEECVDEQWNTLRCRRCGASWHVDAASRLWPATGGEAIALEQCMDATEARFDRLWNARADDPGPVFTADGVTLQAEDGRRERGELALFPDRLALRREGEEPWSLALGEVENLNVEFQRMLEVHTATASFKAELRMGSAWKWPWAARWWAQRG